MFPLKSILEKELRVNWNNLISINMHRGIAEQLAAEDEHEQYLFV